MRRKNLVWVTVAAAVGCGGRPAPAQIATPAPTAPLPTAGLASTHVPVLPLTLVAAEDSLGWLGLLGDRQAALATADSILGALLVARAPEVTWVLPAELRHQARRSPTFASNPDQMATALLRNVKLVDVPDPLRAEIRTLVALAGARYALIPAALVYRRTTPPVPGTAVAELSVVMVDARLGRVGWRTIARGEGSDPWSALTRAVKALTPGLP